MIKEKDRKIEVLNSLEVVDWSASCGELEYVLAKNSEENRRKLLEAGFDERDLDVATDGFIDNDIDLTYLAVNCAGIHCWIKDRGFVEEDEFNEWSLAGLEGESV